MKNKELDNLLLQLGKELNSTSLNAVRLNTSEYRSKAVKWMFKNISALKLLICDNSILVAIGNESNNKAKLILATGDLISGYLTGISPFTVASILVEIGLDELCNNENINLK